MGISELITVKYLRAVVVELDIHMPFRLTELYSSLTVYVITIS